MPDTQTSPLPAGLTPGIDQEARLWAAFAAAGSTEALCRSWLALQCRKLAGANAAMVLLARPGAPFAPVALWPDAAQDLSHLRGVAEECLRTAAPVVKPPPHEGGATGLHIAYPFLAEGEQPVGAVVLDLAPRLEAETKAVLRGLHWGVGWLEAQALRERIGREQQRVAGAAAALDIVAVAQEHDRLEAAAMAIANEMAVRLGAARVAVGLDAGRGMRLVALSHTAWYRRKTPMVATLEQAMEEAAEQRATIRLPATPGAAVRIAAAHEALAAVWEAHGAFTTLPLTTDQGVVGAITLLHDAPPPEPVVQLGEAITALLGPILEHKRRARRLVSGRIVDALRDAAAMLAGPRHLGWKLGGVAAAAALAAAILVPAPFRVSAKAVLEGRVQRAVAAPYEGFIETAPARAGDIVRAGEVLATLRDHDLQLDVVRWRSELERLQVKLREAMAKRDPGTAGQVEAQIRQTDAQIALAREKLARARIVAPIDGVLVSGDLSQSIGAPVETGKVLFEVAPLDDYRVILRADERDIRWLTPGQQGTLLLHGMTGTALPITVTRVTSVAEADEGRNSFRVEATLGAVPPQLRPGMEGIGKVAIAERSFAWVWTRSLVDWLRMQIWAWTP